MKSTRIHKVAQTTSWNDFIERTEKEADYIDLSAYIAFQVMSFMRKNKIKQWELADLLKISQQQVSKFLSGQENLTIDTICKLRNVLKMEIDISISGIENFLNPPTVYNNTVENTSSYFSIMLKHDVGKTLEDHIETAKPIIDSYISNVPISPNGDYSVSELPSEIYAINAN